MTELEQRLCGSEGDAVLAELLNRLNSIASRLQGELRAGLAPEDFKLWQSCWFAVSEATTALRGLRRSS